jgi:hypothetical protein
MFTLREVADIIEADGERAAFVTYATVELDRSTGKVTRGVEASHEVTVVPPNADGGVVEQFGSVDGVKEASLFSIVAALGLAFEPTVGQEFLWNDRTWTVTWVNPIRSNLGVLAYQFGIKGRA